MTDELKQFIESNIDLLEEDEAMFVSKCPYELRRQLQQVFSLIDLTTLDSKYFLRKLVEFAKLPQELLTSGAANVPGIGSCSISSSKDYWILNFSFSGTWNDAPNNFKDNIESFPFCQLWYGKGSVPQVLVQKLRFR